MEAVTLLLTAVALSTPARSEVQLTTVIGRSAVLQRDVNVPVWGMADPEEEVTVSFAGQSKSTTADRFGHWRVELDPLPASQEGRAVTVQGTANRIEVDEVFVGEVFLYLSQSFHLDGRKHTDLLVDETSWSPICDRPADLWEHNCHRRRAQAPVSAKPGMWQRYRKPGKYFRSDGYYFGLGLGRELRVPVGSIGHGASSLECMIPPEGYQVGEKALGELGSEVATWVPTTTRGKQAYLDALAEMGRWIERTERTLARTDVTIADFNQPTELPGPPLIGPGPTTHYNVVTHACMPAAYRGIVIQTLGNNVGDPLYAAKLKALILGLREVSGRPDIPVCVVQMHTPFRYEKSTDNPDDSVAMRPAQAAMAGLPKVTVLATYDLEHVDKNGPDRPLRVSQWAAALVGGSEVLTGPTYAKHTIAAKTVTVTFSNVGEGLMTGVWEDFTTQEAVGASLRGFQLGGADGKWYDASAAIKGEVVEVTSAQVPTPVGVRYAWEPSPKDANLYNRNGFPALPFETTP